MSERERAYYRNLIDAGCSEKSANIYLTLLRAGKKSEMLRLLESYQKELLDRLHADRQKIDCLDFFIFQMKKEKGECVRPEHPR